MESLHQNAIEKKAQTNLGNAIIEEEKAEEDAEEESKGQEDSGNGELRRQKQEEEEEQKKEEKEEQREEEEQKEEEEKKEKGEEEGESVERLMDDVFVQLEEEMGVEVSISPDTKQQEASYLDRVGEKPLEEVEESSRQEPLPTEFPSELGTEMVDLVRGR